VTRTPEPHQDPILGAVVTVNPKEFVDAMFAHLGVPDDFLQFLIQRAEATCPIDAGMDGGKTETQEGLEVAIERFFPGAVVIGASNRR
jgi:hypothetical protein